MLDAFDPFKKKITELVSDDLLKLNSIHEGWYVEYKEAPLNQRGYAKAISAMANTYGGWVFFGVKEESRNQNTAGSFPGISPNQVDLVCQNIRQAITEHLNPQPYFDIIAIDAPAAKNGEKVICVHVPPSMKAPIIHSDGRIYRRVNDASEPVPENNREAIDHLVQRSDRIEKFYKDWFKHDPELSQYEGDVSYIRVLAVPDYWGEHGIWLKESTEEFVELLVKPSGGIYFSTNYENVFSQDGGFVCRQVVSNDATQFTTTLKVWRDLRTEFLLPIPSFDIDEYQSYHDQNEDLDKLVQYLDESGHANSTALDLVNTFGAIDGFFALNRKLQRHLGFFGETFVKFRIRNVWRRVPLIALSVEELGWNKHGVPIILQNCLSSPKSGHLDTFLPLNLHEKTKPDEENFLISMPVFLCILTAMGLNIGNSDQFGDLVHKFVMKSYEKANKLN